MANNLPSSADRKTESTKLRPGLFLYKQPMASGRGSPYWYARATMPVGGRNTHTKSTGTTCPRLAAKFADDFWDGLRVQAKLEGDLDPALAVIRPRSEARFDRVADGWLDMLEAEATNERKVRAFADARHAHLGKGGFAGFFGKDDIRGITTDRIRQYLVHQQQMSVKAELASSTKKRTLATLRSLLRYALEKGLIKAIPLMPKVTLKDRPRGWFTQAEYRRLYVTAWVLARQARERGDRAAQDEWIEIADFVIFMVSTFLRPSEWGSLKHSHVGVIDGPRPHLRLSISAGKTGERIVCSMPSAIRAYDRLLERTGSEGYVFLPKIANRQTAAEKMADRFRKLVSQAGIGPDTFGRSRTMYSLRHSSLMFAVLNESEPFALAKNAGTSLEQLHRFYLSHMTAEMRVAAIHGHAARK